MMLFFKKKQDKTINGIIRYLNLENFWFSCTEEEKQSLTKYYRGGLGNDPKGSPIEGTITSSSTNVFKYLTAMIGWAVGDKNYAFADKIIGALNEYPISEHELIDAHFFYQETAESYYKQRNERVDAIELSITYCNLDIELFPKYSKKLIEEFGMIPNITTFKRLAIIYENQNKYDLAIDICKKALEYGLNDLTKGGYSARLEKLSKKLNGVNNDKKDL